MKFLYIFILLPIFCQAQKNIQGYVLEAETAEGIIGAVVYDSLSGQNCMTNVSGYFNLGQTNDSLQLEIQALGYEKKRLLYIAQTDSLIYIYLRTKALETVEVNANRFFSASSSVELSPKQLEKIPHLGGERDLMKALSIYPGISNTNEGSAQLTVRGGNNGQNLILLDGSIVYNASHFAGFVSIFNADAIKQVKLYKGGFPAEFGGRISSVLDIRMREGSLKKWKGHFGLGILSSRLLLEGPIIKNKLSFMLSGRAAYLGLLTSLRRPAFNTGAINDLVEYNFYDLNAKLNYNLHPKHKIHLSFYTGKDVSNVVSRFANTTTGGVTMTTPDALNQASISGTNINWGNSTATLRYNGLWSDQVFSQIQLGYSDYRYNFGSDSKEYDFNDSIYIETDFQSNSFIQDIHFKWGLSYQPSAKHELKLGVESFLHQYQPYQNIRYRRDSLEQIDTIGDASTSSVWESAIYFSGTFQKGIFKLIYGLRYSAAYTENQWYHSPEPRLALLTNLSENWALRATASRMLQYIHLLANNGVGFPNDIWVPITDQVAPQKAWQYSLAGLWKSPKGWNLELEAYYKKMNDLIDYQYIGGGLLGVSNDWQEDIALDGQGQSYGAELLAEKQFGNWTTFLAYSLSWTYNQFPDIQNNQLYPFKYDRRHQLTAFANWQFSKHWDLSISWTYNSGQAITLPVGRIQAENSLEEFFIYEGRNNARMPAFHRLDLGVHYQKENKKGFIHQWNFDIYNAYNRQNPFALFMREELAYVDQQFITTGYNIYQLSLFPIIPSVSYDFKF